MASPNLLFLLVVGAFCNAEALKASFLPSPVTCAADLCQHRKQSGCGGNGTELCQDKDIDHFLCMMQAGSPFAYAHFNDGEVEAASSAEGVTDRGWQKRSTALMERMQGAMKSTTPRVYKGIPCQNEFEGKPRLWMDNLLQDIDDRCTRAGATVFINRNYDKSKKQINEIISRWDRRVHVVVSENACTDCLPWKTASVVHVPGTNAFDKIDSIASDILKKDIRAGDFVFLMAGPVGRILAVELFAKRPNATFIDMGSFWDGFLDVGQHGQNGYLDVGCT